MAYIYQSGAWATYDSKKYEVTTTTFTTYPFTIKSPTTPVNATIYGNMLQTGTPTPDNPIQPQECGVLETEGTYAGQYKIPILSNSTTTNIYLGEVQSIRKIKKLVLTGEEAWSLQSINSYGIANFWTVIPARFRTPQFGLSSHLILQTTLISDTETEGFYLASSEVLYIRINATRASTVDELKSYLSQEYTNETPLTIWYILDNETTGIINEPLCKIDEFADTVTKSIPVTINGDSVDINTALKPSAVSTPSLSWGTGDDYKRSGGEWS